MFDPSALSGVVIICGHYGVGKTNLSLNLAVDLLREGRAVTLVDLDVVNPYFRSSEYRELIEENGGQVVSPVLANSSLDVPSLSAAVMGAIERARGAEGATTIIDAGGDDVGATALGRFAAQLREARYEMVYVVNSRRSQTTSVAEAAEILAEIEGASGLQATAVFGNDHLLGDTDGELVREGVMFARECASALQLPLLGHTMPKQQAKTIAAEVWEALGFDKLYPVSKMVRTPWEAPGA